jgi:hypothetical protein
MQGCGASATSPIALIWGCTPSPGAAPSLPIALPASAWGCTFSPRVVPLSQVTHHLSSCTLSWGSTPSPGGRCDSLLPRRLPVKGTCVTLLSPTCTSPLGRVKSSPLYLLSRQQRERPLLSPMTCTPDLEYLGSSVGTMRIDYASKSRDVDATCDHLTCDLLLL